MARSAVQTGRQFRGRIVEACWAYSIGNVPVALRVLGAAADVAGALFAAADRTGEVMVTVDGHQFTVPGEPADHNVNEVVWVDACCLAFVVRRDAVLRILAGYPTQRLGAAPGSGEGDVYRIHLAAALRLFWLDDPGWPQPLAEAERLSQPEHRTVAAPRFAAMYRALAPMLRAIATGDQDAFSDGLEAALRAHKAVHGRGAEAKRATGLLALPAAGVAALGVDRGLKLEVESSYAPRWLVEGADPR